MNIVSEIFVLLGFAKRDNYTLTSLTTSHYPSFVLGMLVSFTVGGFIAAIQYNLFSKLRTENIILKCAAFGTLMYYLLEIIFTIFIEGKIIPVRQLSGHFSHYISAICFGIIEGILLNRFLFNKHTEK